MKKEMIKLDLQRFATPILDMFNQKTVIDYTRNRKYRDLLGDTLFPATKVPTLEVDILKAGSRVPTIANISAFDTEAEIGSRDATKMTAELAYVKRKVQITEEMLVKLRYPRNTAEENYLKQYVFDDIDAMVQAVLARGEQMTIEMFATVAVSTVGIIKNKDSRKLWSEGFTEMLERLEPKRVLLYGADTKYPFPADLEIVRYSSNMRERFSKLEDKRRGW